MAISDKKIREIRIAFQKKIIFTAKVETLCGIVGIWIKNSNAANHLDHLEAAVKAIEHRGPDHIGIKKYAKLGLGHARLSILDLSASAHQPMLTKSGQMALVFNGEIYNHKVIRENLELKGYEFTTEADTEVLLNHISEKGIGGVRDLNGFFSFLHYDAERDVLSFARDRFGIKPMYIYEDDEKCIFASELKSILEFQIDRSLNHKAINLLFGLTYIPAPLSVLKQVRQLKPGELGWINNEGLHIESYYDIDASESNLNLSYEEAKKEVKSRVELAVKRRLEADVPLGTFLSGGVDSSIVSLISKTYKKDLKTFSIGFGSPFFDESRFADMMAKSIGSDHHKMVLTKADFKRHFSDFLTALDEPFGDSSAFAVYLLSQYVSSEVSVCLSGDGADELFGGYRKYAAEFKLRNLALVKRVGLKFLATLLKGTKRDRGSRWGDLNRKLQKMTAGFSLSISERYWQWANFIDNDARQALLLNDRSNTEFKPKVGEDLNALFKADQQLVLANDMLVKVDRMSMAHALEVRTPFLDHELVEFVNRLPAEYKVNVNGRKQILIDAFKDQLPDPIYKREKKGFEIPLFDWLSEDLKAIFESKLFSKSYIESQGLFNYDYICCLQKEWGTPQFGDRIYLVWTLIIFQNWWDRYIKIDGKKNTGITDH